MNKFSKDLFNYLIKYENFYMENFTKSTNKSEQWIAIKKFKEGIYAVVITDEENEKNIEKEAHIFLKSKNENYRLNIIILSKNNYKADKNKNTSKIILDIERKEILYLEQDAEVLGKIVLEVLRERNRHKKNYLKYKWVTLILITINVVIFLISAFLSKNILNIDNYTLLYLGGKFGPLIDKGEVWRLVACNFLHGGLMHIACNMYSLYIIGSQVEAIYGKIKYVLIYFICGICSSLLSYIGDYNTLSIGASGAIFGLMGALLIFLLKNRDVINKETIINFIVIIFINLYIGMSFSNIDNLGHIGGLFSGIIMGIILNFLGRRQK